VPPRYAYWTILIDGKATAFRARERDELLPTFNQLARKNADIAMRYFARGRLWDSPAQAQWATFDGPAYTQRLKKEIRDILEWVDTIAKWETTIVTATQQLTSLRGMLSLAEGELAKDKETARLMNDIGDIVRSSQLLISKTKSMVKYGVASLQRIDDRLRNGIFDPDKDLADLEEYLLYSIGRESKETLRLAVEAAVADPQLNKWLTERQNLALDLAEAEANREQLLSRLKKAEKSKNESERSGVQPLTDALLQTLARIVNLMGQIRELGDKIEKHLKAHGLRLSDMENFGYSIEATKAAWKEMNGAKDHIASTFDAAVLKMAPEPPDQ